MDFYLRNIKITLASLLIFGVIAPITFAQNVDPQTGAPEDVTASTTEVAVVSATQDTAPAQGSDVSSDAVSPQQSAPVQDTGDVNLQETTDPNLTVVASSTVASIDSTSTTTDASSTVIAIDSATSTDTTSTPIEIPPSTPTSTISSSTPTVTNPASSTTSSTTITSSTTTSTPIQIPPPIQLTTSTAPTVIAQLAPSFEAHDIPTGDPQEPAAKFAFHLKGGNIPTKKSNGGASDQWRKNIANRKLGRQLIAPSSTDIAVTPTLGTDNTKGVLQVSGSCTDKYYVILVYAHADDYAANPASYIFNKAFDCVNGSYTYSVKDLPDTLADGTYYLLVGSQGDTGSWVPLTALVPVDVQKTNL